MDIQYCVYVIILLTQLNYSAGTSVYYTPRDEYTDDREYYKYKLRLTSIPTDIPADAVRVIITYNYITRIPANIFSHLNQCVGLDLFVNQISTIEPGAFNGLYKIRTINIDSNELTELNSGMFQGAESVQHLSLYDNIITTIADDTFINLKNLSKLWLYNNNLKTLSQQMFSGLENLQELLLTNNDLTMLPADVFRHMQRPLALNVAGNPLTCDAALCWFKQEKFEGTVTWPSKQGLLPLVPECTNRIDWYGVDWVCTVPTTATQPPTTTVTTTTSVRTDEDQTEGYNNSNAESDTNDNNLQWILITVGAVVVTAIVTAVFLVIYFKRRFCFKRKSGSETQNQGSNNVNTGFTNRAVSIVMDNVEGYEGLQREVEGYEKLRGGSNAYEEIPEHMDGYLDPQMPGRKTTAGTDTDGNLKPQKASEEYDDVVDMPSHSELGRSEVEAHSDDYAGKVKMVEYAYSCLPNKKNKSTIPPTKESAFKGDSKEATAEYFPAAGKVEMVDYDYLD